MPTKTLPYNNKDNDKRRKLTDTERETIKELYTRQGATLRGLGRKFGVDRHTIKAIVDPSWYKNKQQQRYNKKPWLDYYDKEQWKHTMRKHRARERSLGLMIKGDTITVPPDRLTLKEAYKHFKTIPYTLKQQVPHERHGRTVTFSIQDLNEWNKTRKARYKTEPHPDTLTNPRTILMNNGIPI